MLLSAEQHVIFSLAASPLPTLESGFVTLLAWPPVGPAFAAA